MQTAAAKALDWMRQVVEFADGLHLANAEGSKAFISFDQDFIRAANTLGGIKVRALTPGAHRALREPAAGSRPDGDGKTQVEREGTECVGSG